MVLIRKKARSMRRRPYRKPKLTLAKLAKVVRRNRPETKYHLIQEASDQPDTVGEIYNLSEIVQGDGATGRTGLWVKPTSLRLRCTTQDTNTGLGYTRLILFQWSDNATNAPTPSKVFLNQTGGANPSVWSMINPIFRTSIKVLKDKLVAHPQFLAAGNSGSKGSPFVWNVRIPKAIKFQDDLGTNYEKNNLFICAISTTATASFSYEGALFFIDP